MNAFIKFQLASLAVWIGITGFVPLSLGTSNQMRFAVVHSVAYVVQFLATLPLCSSGRRHSRQPLIVFLASLPVPVLFTCLSLLYSSEISGRAFLWSCLALLTLQYFLLDFAGTKRNHDANRSPD